MCTSRDKVDGCVHHVTWTLDAMTGWSPDQLRITYRRPFTHHAASEVQPKQISTQANLSSLSKFAGRLSSTNYEFSITEITFSVLYCAFSKTRQ